MSLLYDDDFQSYAVGAFPPYGNLFNIAIIAPKIANSVPPGGVFGAAKYVNMASLPSLIWPTTTPSTALPAYSEFSVFQHVLILGGQGSDEQGAILQFNCNLSPFAGISLAALRVLSDGTLAFTAPQSSAFSPNQFVSNDSILVNAWYSIQTNVRFFAAGAFVGVDVEVAINNKSVFAGSFVTTQTVASLPALFVNNLIFGGLGGGCAYGRITVSDTILPIGADPHAGTPDVRVTQGAIELILAASGGLPVPVCPIGGGNATVGQLYNKTLTASGGIPPYTWNVTGLPPGITFNPVSGQLLGIPTTPGTFTYLATVTDLATAMGSVNCTIVVVASLTVDIQFWGVLRFLVPVGSGDGDAAEYSAIGRQALRSLAAIALRAASVLLDQLARTLAPASSGRRLQLAASPASAVKIPIPMPAALETAADKCNLRPFVQPVAQTTRETNELGIPLTLSSPRIRFSGGFSFSWRPFVQPVAQTTLETNGLGILPCHLAGAHKTPTFLGEGISGAA